MKQEDKKFIELLIANGIKEFGNDFWFDNTEDRLELWEDEVNISEFIDDTGYDYKWINDKSNQSYNSNELRILEGEVSYNGDWFITKIIDSDNNIVALTATID